MSRTVSPLAVWQQIPVANRTVQVNTKTGFSLTAGSYVVRASSMQIATINCSGTTSATATISSATTTRADAGNGGTRTDDAVANDRFGVTIVLTNATTVTATRITGTNSTWTSMTVWELF